MEISSFQLEEDPRYAARTLSDISIASNASGKQSQNFSSFGATKYVRDTRVKFLCSYGGKIFPRPSDKRLRYVGGETRMMSVPRHIRFTAFLLKLREIYGPDVTLKYQLPEEDLDALVSVSSEEDLENMMEECDRLDAMEGSSKLRVFVFPSSDHDDIDFNDIADPKVSEHRYVEAVNTIQTDVSLKQGEGIALADSYRSSSEPLTSYASAIQERASALSEYLQSQGLLPAEQLAALENLTNLKFPARNNASGQLAPPSRMAVSRQWSEPVSTQHVNYPNVQVSQNDLFDRESGGSASSSISSQQDHRYRWGSNSQMPSAMGQGEADSNVHATLAASPLPSEVISKEAKQLNNFETAKDVKEPENEALEDEPLSPGSELQRQLLADQHPSEMDSSRQFRKKLSQSSLDGNTQELISLSHERQQTEQLPFYNPANMYTQEGVLTSGQVVLDPSNLQGKGYPLSQEASYLRFPTSAAPISLTGQFESAEKPVFTLQHVKVPEPSLFPTASPHVDNIRIARAGESDGFVAFVPQPLAEGQIVPYLHAPSTENSVMSEVEKALCQVHPAMMDLPDLNGLDSGLVSQAAWLAPGLASFPSGENAQVETLHLSGIQNKMINSLGIAANQLDDAGLSLLDQPVDNESKLFSAAIPDVKVGQDSSVMMDCSTKDIMSDALTTAPSVSCFSSQLSQPNGLASTMPDHMAKARQDLADNMSVLTSEGHSEGINYGFFQGADLLKQPLYKENVPCFSADDGITRLNTKENFDLNVEEGPATISEGMHPSSFLTPNSPKDIWNTKVQLERERQTAMLHVSHEQDVTETGSTLIVENDPIVENSKLEVVEEDIATERPVNAAAIAEAEAIARGLQTIRNFDLEELKELGAGTFGTVYHGKWRGTDVAIKRIKSSCFTGRPSERERLLADFWQEAYILGQLHHPNVVAFYGVVPDGPDGTLATVTEFMVNGSLKQALQKKDRILDRRKRLLIAMDAAFGMEYLHKKNVVHFDLKCENLLVNLRDLQRPICKVGDLGLSKVKQQTMISGGVRGTLPWMAPELLNGSSSLVSEKVDVFSFGIVLWELLTGDEPYASMHYGAIIGGIVTNTLRPVVPTWCDASWRSLMEACWAADPAERPTFSEIASSLRAMDVNLNAKVQGRAAVAE